MRVTKALIIAALPLAIVACSDEPESEAGAEEETEAAQAGPNAKPSSAPQNEVLSGSVNADGSDAGASGWADDVSDIDSGDNEDNVVDGGSSMN